jgi:hypothetical protein
MADNVVLAAFGGIIGLLQGVIILMLSGQNKKIQAVCSSVERKADKGDNDTEHKELWERIYHHSHDISDGKVKAS